MKHFKPLTVLILVAACSVSAGDKAPSAVIIDLVPVPTDLQFSLSEAERQEFITSCTRGNQASTLINQTTYCQCTVQLLPIYISRTEFLSAAATINESGPPSSLKDFPKFRKIQGICLRQQIP